MQSLYTRIEPCIEIVSLKLSSLYISELNYKKNNLKEEYVTIILLTLVSCDKLIINKQ